MEKSKNFVSILFLVVIISFMLAILFRFAVREHIDDWFPWMQPIASEEEVNTNSAEDWSKKYPFDEENSFVYSQKNDAEIANETDYIQTVNTLKNNIEYYSTKLLIGRIKFVEANALFNKLVGNKIIVASESVTLMKNGYLTFVKDKIDMSYDAESVKWFSDKMNEKNINFMYVQYPAKESINDNQLPDGVSDNNNENITELLSKLNEYNVPTLDFRNLLEQKDDKYYENFFKTDHHWKPETGVWASGQIVKALNQNYGLSLDEEIGNIENYNVDVYEKFCFGSQGKMATLSYADPEDISLIYPKCDTDYTVTYDESETKTGTFKQTLLGESVFDSINYYGVSTYGTYLYGINAIVNIKNNSISNGKHLVFVTDSFGNCVAPFLSQDFEYVDVIDLRNFNGSLLDYIEKHNPDTVIVGCNPSVFTTDTSHSTMFNFE